MAFEIKATPILDGKDADKVVKQMNEIKPVSKSKIKEELLSYLKFGGKIC